MVLYSSSCVRPRQTNYLDNSHATKYVFPTTLTCAQKPSMHPPPMCTNVRKAPIMRHIMIHKPLHSVTCSCVELHASDGNGP